jgi:hypothetical protein
MTTDATAAKKSPIALKNLAGIQVFKSLQGALQHVVKTLEAHHNKAAAKPRGRGRR